MLPAQEARRRFAAARVARLATVDGQGHPHIVPVTFAVDGDHIYSAVDAKPKTTTRLRRLRNIAAHPGVAVLADHYDDNWDRLWWVRADGRAAVLTQADEKAEPLHLLAERYPQYQVDPPDGPVIRIVVERWTGWSAGTPRSRAEGES
ncbi:MAG TPA: TIGR03668 family PPOX class F420-dependent oxidoreductase [Streptosporangiaceae bacterium]